LPNAPRTIRSATASQSQGSVLWLAIAGLGAFGLYQLATSAGWQQRLGKTAESLFKPMLVPLIDLINASAFVYMTSAIILLSAIVLCKLYWHRAVRPRLAELTRLRLAVGLLTPPTKSAPDWPAAHRTLVTTLAHSGLFPAGLAAFQIDSAEVKGVVGTPFSVYAAKDQDNANARQDGLMQALPGYYTSVGLILTFLGLVVALYFAARGFRTGDMVSAKAAIVQLLNAASFKFLTSVAALISALLVSLSSRFMRGRLRRETAATLTAIDTYLAVWRAAVPAHVSRDSDVVERLDRLISSFERLETTLAQALRARSNAA
jgi:hypothetical protein